MKVFDINIHLPCKGKNLGEHLPEDLNMEADDLIGCFDYYKDDFLRMSGGNFMLFNEKIDYKEVLLFTQYVKRKMAKPFFTLLVDFRSSTDDHLERMQQSGIDAIKFHSYVQRISEEDFEQVLLYARKAEKLNLPIFIDTSYGTTKMYQYDNLKLSAYLLDHIKDTPVVLLHTGCSRVMDAFLLAASCDNVFLDGSFNINTYLGSSVEKDIAFCYKKIGFDRVVYGSDSPYVSCEESLHSVKTFFLNNGINQNQQEKMLSTSWRGVFGA